MSQDLTQDLVFTETDELNEIPFTTSKIIAEGAQLEHHSITILIQKYQSDFEEFGRVRFEIDTLQTKGGMQQTKYYNLNEQQTALLFTYMKNSPIVRKFKKSLVKAFFSMSAELLKRKVTREIGIKERRTITDAIKEYVPESPNKKFYYKNYTDLVYKSVLGMSAKKYQLSMEIPDGKIRDYLTEQQLKKIAQIEDVVKTLLSIGKGYEEIKNILKK